MVLLIKLSIYLAIYLSIYLSIHNIIAHDDIWRAYKIHDKLGKTDD